MAAPAFGAVMGEYYYSDMATPLGGETVASALNEAGMIAGLTGTAIWPQDNYDAFVADRSGVVTPINPLFSLCQSAFMNERGQIAGVGTQRQGTTFRHSIYRYTPGTGMVDLGALGTVHPFYGVCDINDAGAILGATVLSPCAHATAFVHTDATGFRTLDRLGQFAFHPSDINNHGDVVGHIITTDWTHRPAISRDGVTTMIGDEPGTAHAINDDGWVIGQTFSAGAYRGFVWHADQGFLPLVCFGVTPDDVTAINDRNQIVGSWRAARSNEIRAFCMDLATGQVDDLGVPFAGFIGGVLPVAINNHGEVLAQAHTSSYETIALFWSEATGLINLSSRLNPEQEWHQAQPIDMNDRGEMLIRATLDAPSGSTVSLLVWPIRRGDVNRDRVVDFEDINGFIAALSGEAAFAEMMPDGDFHNADANADGVVNFDDIEPFVARMISAR